MYGIYEVDPKELVEHTLSSPCGHCGKASWFRLASASWAGEYYAGQHDQRPLISAMYQCGGCERASIFTYQTFGVSGDIHTSLLDRFPMVGALANRELPEEIERDRHEAWVCFNNGQHRAAVLMGRSALQRAVRLLLDESSKRDSLFNEINALFEAHIITESQKTVAHEVRLSGNDVAHPEDMGAVTEGEAKESLEFLDDFLQTTIVVPQRARERADRRRSSE